VIGGSQQLRLFRRARRDGATLEDAAAAGGMGLAEARMWAEDDDKNPPPPEAYILLPDFPATPRSRPAVAQHKEATMARGKQEEPASNGPIRPDFDKMKQLFGRIQTAEEKNATARGDLSGYWTAIEDDCHAHKAAAKQLRRLWGMSEEARTDYLRTLLGGLEAFDMLPKLDLVDQMEAFTAAGLGDDGVDDE
jgi:hypothetical protein